MNFFWYRNKQFFILMGLLLNMFGVVVAMEYESVVSIPFYCKPIERWKINEMKSFSIKGSTVLANEKGQSITAKELYLLDKALQADKKNQFQQFCQKLRKKDGLDLHAIGNGQLRMLINASDKAEVARLRNAFINKFLLAEVQGYCIKPMINVISRILKDEIIKRKVPHRGMVLAGHSGDVRSVAFSSGNSVMASVSHNMIENNLMIWGCATKKSIRNVTIKACPNVVTFSSDSSLLAVGAEGGSVFVCDIDGAIKRTMAIPRLNVSALQFSHDGEMIVVGYKGEQPCSKLKIWYREIENEHKDLEAYADILFVAFSPDDTKIVSVDCAAFKNIKVWDVLTGNVLWLLKDSSCTNYIAEFNGSDDWLIAGYVRDRAKGTHSLTWHDLSKQQSVGYVEFDNQINPCPFTQTCSSNGFNKMLFDTVDHQNSVKMWSFSTGQELVALSGHLSDVQCTAYSADGTMFASGSSGNNNLILWEILTGEEQQALEDLQEYKDICGIGLLYDLCHALLYSQSMQFDQIGWDQKLFSMLPETLQILFNSLFASHPKKIEQQKKAVIFTPDQKKMATSEALIKSHFLPKEDALQEINVMFPEGVKELEQKRLELIMFVNSKKYGCL